jgi:biopolymer transport protein TolR
MGPIGSSKGRKGFVAEINVTPLVDVMLVLLIIFMVTAPMMTQGLEVDLPETRGKSLKQQDEPLVVSIRKDGEVYLKKEKVTSATLRQVLGGMTPEQKKEAIFLRADKNVPYGSVVTTMGDIKSSGFEKLSMITLPSDKKEE